MPAWQKRIIFPENFWRLSGSHRNEMSRRIAVLPNHARRDLGRARSNHHSRRPRKRNCDSMTDSSSCARSNPALPLLGFFLRSLSIRRSAAATRSRARSRSATVYCRGSGRVRFLRGRFAATPGEDGRLELLPNRHRATPIIPADPPIKHIRRGFVSRVALILGCMELGRPPLVVAFELNKRRKAIVADALAGASAVVYLTELDEASRAEALRNTGALLTFNTSKELRSGEAKLLGGARLIQFMIAGVDFTFPGLPPGGCASGNQRWRLCRIDG